MVQPEEHPAGGSAHEAAAGRGDAGPARENPTRRGAAGPARDNPTGHGQAPRRGSVAEGGEGGARPSTTLPPGAGAGFELLEHTADVGIRARGAILEEAFEQATLGLAEVQGAPAPGPEKQLSGRGEAVAVQVSASDPGGLLVDWLNEVLWLTETRRAAVAGVQVERVGDGTASGWVVLASGRPAPDGSFVKAVTYHRLRVEPDPDGGWLVEVYLDV
jgi:SHS2 domain-containing protein